jgi:hypothetical protein
MRIQYHCFAVVAVGVVAVDVVAVGVGVVAVAVGVVAACHVPVSVPILAPVVCWRNDNLHGVLQLHLEQVELLLVEQYWRPIVKS